MSNQWPGLFKDAATCAVDYLLDGVQTFESYVETIETAKGPGHYVYLLGWMLDIDFPLAGTLNRNYGKPNETYFKGDDKKLLSLLKKATDAGVEVRVLVWKNPLNLVKNGRSVAALNQLKNTKAFLDDDTFSPAATKKIIAQYEPAFRQVIEAARPILNQPFLKLRFVEEYEVPPDALLDLILHYLDTGNLGAHHEKVLIVNGTNGLIAHCGGLDVNPNRLTSYHDAACRVRGPAAHEILGRFVRRWSNHGEAKSVPLTGANDTTPKPLGPSVGNNVMAQVVGTFNSPDARVQERSGKEAYLKVISNARNYIYLEDQYMVNLDVANALNKKLKQELFKVLVLVVQDARETTDILTPFRRRNDFFKAMTQGLSAEQLKKCSFFMLNQAVALGRQRHPGLHAKTLIVDDEIAIIGSMNINQRSFTLDSETSLLFFDATYASRENLAYKLRQSIWNDYVLKPSGLSEITWEEFVRHVNAEEGYALVTSYENKLDDLDVRINDTVKAHAVALTYGALEVLGTSPKALQAISIINSSVAVTEIIDLIFENIIDPRVP